MAPDSQRTCEPVHIPIMPARTAPFHRPYQVGRSGISDCKRHTCKHVLDGFSEFFGMDQSEAF